MEMRDFCALSCDLSESLVLWPICLQRFVRFVQIAPFGMKRTSLSGNTLSCEILQNEVRTIRTRFSGETIRTKRPDSHPTCQPWALYHSVLQGAAQRGGQSYFIFAVLRTLLHAAR